LAIAEEKSKAMKISDMQSTLDIPAKPSESSAPIQNHSEPVQQSKPSPSVTDENAKRIKDLEQEVMDLKITNRGKDYFIEQLTNDRKNFTEERQTFVDKLITFTRKVGELETKLQQLGSPNNEP
jgi:hypothetical protein